MSGAATPRLAGAMALFGLLPPLPQRHCSAPPPRLALRVRGSDGRAARVGPTGLCMSKDAVRSDMKRTRTCPHVV